MIIVTTLWLSPSWQHTSSFCRLNKRTTIKLQNWTRIPPFARVLFELSSILIETTNENLQRIIVDLFSDKLSRHIIVKFVSHQDRQADLKKLLKGTKIAITEGLTRTRLALFRRETEFGREMEWYMLKLEIPFIGLEMKESYKEFLIRITIPAWSCLL